MVFFPINSFRGAGLDHPHHVRKGHLWVDAEEQMNVIRHTSDFECPRSMSDARWDCRSAWSLTHALWLA